MAKFVATMLHAETGAEGRNGFDGPDALLSLTPNKVIPHFMKIVDRDYLPGEHIDYELNAAMTNKQRGVVTAMGSLILESGAPLPFLVMIAAEQ